MIAFILVTIISSIGGILGLSVITNTNLNYSKALKDYGSAQGDIGLFNTEFNNGRVIIQNIIFQTDSQVIQTNMEQLNLSNAKLSQYLIKMKSGMITTKEVGYYNEINADLSKFFDVRLQVINLASQNKRPEAQALMAAQGEPLSDKIRTSTNALLTEKTTSGNQLASTLSSEGATATSAILIIILVSLIISLIIALSISRGISKPVKEMAAAAQRMAEGDLSVQIGAKSKDEIGKLGAAFSETIATIKAYITDIKSGLAKVEQGDLTVSSRLEYKGDFIELQKSIN